MLSKLLFSWCLIALCVAIHAGGVASALLWLPHHTNATQRFWPLTWLFIRVAVRMILMHLVEITVWAFFFFWKGALEDMSSALYFSAVTYTTTGYGDLVLPTEWRMLAGVEALTGILMCGWSAGFFFAIASRMLRRDPEQAH
jgi:Ion channel